MEIHKVINLKPQTDHGLVVVKVHVYFRLTCKVLSRHRADSILHVYYFSENIELGISCELFARHTII